ncbi:MAG: hypothetical protein ACE5JR_04355 [Gemmatimonadota bacterium]
MRAISIAALLGALGCGRDFSPVLVALPEEPEEATLTDFLTGDLGDPAAFDLVIGESVRTDLVLGWDFVFFLPSGGVPEFRLRGQILNEDSDAGLRRASRSFDAIQEAPDSGYVRDRTVPIAVGDVFFAVSRRDPTFGSLRCRHFAKLEILALDAAESTVTFRHLINPNCEQRSLVPGAEG